jgi:hypothetical protein
MSASHTVCTRQRILSRRKHAIQVDSWDTAIAKARLRIEELKVAIRGFEIQKKVGEKWPGDSAI